MDAFSPSASTDQLSADRYGSYLPCTVNTSNGAFRGRTAYHTLTGALLRAEGTVKEVTMGVSDDSFADSLMQANEHKGHREMNDD